MILVKNNYHNLGRLSSRKFLRSTANAEAYSYDIRSRTTGITHSSFIQDLTYTFGSDVSSAGWKRVPSGIRMAYDFSYDGVNAAAEYAYDANGNLVSDANKGISSVTWNEIDHPQTVTFSTGSTINYYYAADGTKLREVRTVSGTTNTIDWCDDLVLETDDYYPLGGPLPTGSNTASQPEKYQGKDWNTAASFNVYDFGARLYDPALGRWLAQDPLAEK